MGHVPYAHVGKTHSLAPAIDSRLAQTKAMRQAAQQAITHAQQITIRATKYEPFEEGQKVWLEATHLKTMHPTAKLGPRRYGPFKITKKLSHVVYQLHIPQQWKIHDVFHAALLTPYKETEEHGPNYHEPPPRRHRGRTGVGGGANHGGQTLRTIQTTPIPSQVDRVLQRS